MCPAPAGTLRPTVSNSTMYTPKYTVIICLRSEISVIFRKIFGKYRKKTKVWETIKKIPGILIVFGDFGYFPEISQKLSKQMRSGENFWKIKKIFQTPEI